MFNKKKEDNMKAKDVITQMTSGDTFYITYYAKKHQAIITRKGTWTNLTQIHKANISFQKEMISLSIGI